jgi:hypothetical protein
MSSNEKDEKRCEARTKKEIAIVFVHKKRNLDACTLNYSKNGLAVKIFRKVALPVGNTVELRIKDSATKAQVMWTKKEIDPFITMAGLKMDDGALNLKGARKNTNIIMKDEKTGAVSQPLF